MNKPNPNLLRRSTLGRWSSTFVCALALLIAHPILAQDQRLPTLPPTADVNLTMEQRHVNKELSKDQNVPSQSVKVKVGDTLPSSVNLHPMPADVGAKVSSVKNHFFFKDQDGVVIVDPKNKKVVDVIEQ